MSRSTDGCLFLSSFTPLFHRLSLSLSLYFSLYLLFLSHTLSLSISLSPSSLSTTHTLSLYLSLHILFLPHTLSLSLFPFSFIPPISHTISGGLPPDARKEQARLFSAPDSGYDVLVASDAIGMGLNLSIKRIIFSTVEKYDGRMKRKLFSSVSLSNSKLVIFFKFFPVVNS